MTFITEVKAIQTEINALKADIDGHQKELNNLMIKRTLACAEVGLNASAKGAQKEKEQMAKVANKTTSQKTFSFWRRVAKKYPELKTATKEERAKFMEDNDLTSWRKIDAFEKEEKTLSELEQALVDAMVEVTRQPEFEGIVDQENGEVDKLVSANTKVILAIRAKVDADNPANSK